MHAPLRGIFGPNSVNVARYASLIGTRSPTKWDAQLAESNFQTRPRPYPSWIIIGNSILIFPDKYIMIAVVGPEAG
ncbi:MAG: DUF6783 domain-containing protein [Enterocloster aldenensis]